MPQSKLKLIEGLLQCPMQHTGHKPTLVVVIIWQRKILHKLLLSVETNALFHFPIIAVSLFFINVFIIYKLPAITTTKNYSKSKYSATSLLEDTKSKPRYMRGILYCGKQKMKCNRNILTLTNTELSRQKSTTF